MSKVLGEARLNAEAGKWYYIIYTESGEVLFQSESEFNSQVAAETVLFDMLRGLAQKAKAEKTNRGPSP